MLGQFGKENAAAIFELFRECMPDYPVSKTDAEGNTGQKISSHCLIKFCRLHVCFITVSGWHIIALDKRDI